MSKNGCIEEKESPAANLLAVSKKATGLSSFTLFQLKSVFERFADSAADLVVAVSIGVKGNRLKGVDVNLAILHDGLLNRGSHNLSDHTQPGFVALVLDEFTLNRNGKLVDDRSVHQF